MRNRPNYQCITQPVTKIGEVKALISNIPDDYTVSLMGLDTFGIIVDIANKNILLDDVAFIEALQLETKE